MMMYKTNCLDVIYVLYTSIYYVIDIYLLYIVMRMYITYGFLLLKNSYGWKYFIVSTIENNMITLNV